MPTLNKAKNMETFTSDKVDVQYGIYFVSYWSLGDSLIGDTA